MHSHKNGWTSVVELGSNTLISYDEDMKEIEKIEGKPSKMPGHGVISYTNHGGSAQIMLLFRGHSSLLKIQLALVHLEEIEDFFCPPDTKTCTPLIAICNPECTTLVGLSQWEGSSTALTVLAPGEKIRHVLVDLKFKGIRTIAALELDKSSKHLFIAGSTMANYQGEGIIQVLTLDKKMKDVSMMVFSDNGQRCVSKILRIQDSDKLLLGTTCFVHVIEFANDRLSSLAKIRLVDKGSMLSPGSDLISDMAIVGDMLYACYETDKKMYSVKFNAK